MIRRIGILLIVILLVTGLGGVVYAQELPSSSTDPAVEAQGPPLVLPLGGSYVITFDEYPLGTYITNQYKNVGIIFGGDAPRITLDGANPTMPVLAGSIPGVFQGDITGTFVMPGTDTPCTVGTFEFDAGYFDGIGTTTIEWFDPDGNSLGLIYNSQTGIEHFIIQGGNIASWEIAYGGDWFGIDNVWFEFEPCPTPPLPLPSNCIYLHCEDGLFNLTEPVDTQWHELWPFFCQEYHLSSWNDTSGDDVLSHCDWVDMYEKPDGEVKPYHVEEVTITLYLTPERNALAGDGFGQIFLGEPMYVELEGGYDPAALTDPIGTQWHEIYPNFCTSYNLTEWDDNGNVTLDFCDYILLMDKESGNVTSWHVEDVAIDIVVCREPPPVGGEAYPVSKASLLAPWIAVGVVLAGGISWYILRRRRA